MPNLQNEQVSKKARLHRLAASNTAPAAANEVDLVTEIGALETVTEMAEVDFYDDPFRRKYSATRNVEDLTIALAAKGTDADQIAFRTAQANGELLHFAIVIAPTAAGVRSTTEGLVFRFSGLIRNNGIDASDQNNLAMNNITIAIDGGITVEALT